MKAKYSFSKHATATTWTVALFLEDKHEAERIADEAFALIEVLENELSRFKTGGDIVRINRMEADETITISRDTYDCLREAMVLSAMTNGAFDLAMGTVMDAVRSRGGSIGSDVLSSFESQGQLIVHEHEAAVTCVAPGMNIDLGGIGKGFIIDRVANFLKEDHNVECAMIDGNSSIYAWHNGETQWRFRIGNEKEFRRIDLNGYSISCSSFSEKGAHIIDPRKKEFAPVEKQVWSFAPRAAWADALSTAFMILNEKEIEDCCEENQDLNIGCLYETTSNSKELNAQGWLPEFIVD